MKGMIASLWFDQGATEAAEFYVSLFDNARVNYRRVIHGTPSGDVEWIDFTLANLHLFAMSAGPAFKLNPSISLMVSCDSKEEVDRLYETLSPGGSILMPLGDYPFSHRYAWIEDVYGLHWQLMLSETVHEDYKIVPSLLFSAVVCGQASAAADFYTSVFPASTRGQFEYYDHGDAQDPRAQIKYGELSLNGQPLVLMDNGYGGEASFNEAFSIQVLCDDQEEIDYFWEKLSADPEAEVCGWLKDRFGVSWQIVPVWLDEISRLGTDDEVDRVNAAFLSMKKIDLATLKAAI